MNFKDYQLKALQEKLKEKQMDDLDRPNAIVKYFSKAINKDVSKYLK